MPRVKLRPGEELTLERIEMDAQICRQWPAGTEYYEAQVELNRQRAHLQSQKRVIGSSS